MSVSADLYALGDPTDLTTDKKLDAIYTLLGLRKRFAIVDDEIC